MSAAWVRPFRLTPMPRLRLACFPHAGGSASFFRSWSERLPPDIDLLALQYPGREDRFNEAPATRLEDLADGAALALRDFADAPLALFGHSLGAALAYETALRLESAGAPLRHLFVSAHPAPHRQRGGALHRGDEAALLEDVRRQGGASELLEDADLRALFLPILRADYQAIETYRRAQPIALACALDVLLGEHDEEVSAAEAQAWSCKATANSASPGSRKTGNCSAPTPWSRARWRRACAADSASIRAARARNTGKPSPMPA